MGPCGGLPRGATPTVLTAGTQLTVQWEETIQHPGKYFISFSPANDAGFEANRLATIVDTQNGQIAGVSHKYTANIRVPNTPCDGCTLQLIQSMEENPLAPTFYYSCADIRIVASGALPTPSPPQPTPPLPRDNVNVSSQSTSTNQVSKVGGGCGTVAHQNNSSSLGLIFLLPLFVWAYLVTIVRRQRPARAL